MRLIDDFLKKKFEREASKNEAPSVQLQQ